VPSHEQPVQSENPAGYISYAYILMEIWFTFCISISFVINISFLSSSGSKNSTSKGKRRQTKKMEGR
jgi:hypothetical protein